MARIAGSNLTKVKRHNSAFIKEIIYKYGPISRSQIAEMLSLTPPTITTNVSELLAAGVVEELGCEREREDTTPGRRPVDIDFVCDYAYFVGVEIAPRNRFICLTDLRGHVIVSKQQTSETSTYDDVLEEVVEQVEDIIALSGISRHRILAVGVGVPGFVESNPGVVRSFRRFDWTNRPLGDDLRKRLNMQVRVENNTRVRAIGEDLLGKKNRPDTFAYFFVSQGIACPLVIKNSIFSGTTAGAGEVGHMVMDLNGPKCDTCGNNGCLEAYSSEAAILKRCRGIMSAGVDTVLCSIVQDPEELTLEHVLQAMGCGDGIVISMVQTAVRYLAVAVANVINFISPQLIIVDAYIMKSQENKQFFMDILKTRLYGLNDTEVEIEFKEYDRLSGAKGAAAEAIKHFFIKEAEQ